MFVQEQGTGYARRVLLVDLAAFVASVGAWTALALLDGWWRLLAGIIIGLQLGRASIVAYRRAAAYRTGWLRGRSQMLHAMVEAHRRGLSMHEWLDSELSRDYAVLGLTPEDAAALPTTEE